MKAFLRFLFQETRAVAVSLLTRLRIVNGNDTLPDE